MGNTGTGKEEPEGLGSQLVVLLPSPKQREQAQEKIKQE